MAIVTVLGAGYMGSAMTVPLSERGFETRLWGTWLDDEIIDRSKTAEHPRLKQRLPESVRLYSSSELDNAVEGADAVFVGVSSEGFVPVFAKLVAALRGPVPIFTLTKGFAEFDGEVDRASRIAKRIFATRFPASDLDWTSIGGPVKAYELARHIPSPAVYGTNSAIAARLGPSFQTDYYKIRTTSDLASVELAGTLKNVYAIALGICDGLYEESLPNNYHNLGALLFTQAIREMAEIVGQEKGSATTIYDFAGVGDLHVTARSGKNQRFGFLIGRGISPNDAYRQMLAEGELAEGYPAVKAGERWLRSRHPDVRNRLPLFRALYRITYETAPPEPTLKEAITELFGRV